MTAAGTVQLRFTFLLREIENLRAARGVRAIGMVLIRLSGLRSVNEMHDYDGGDQLLENFARRLKAVARPQDRVFQINGTTFALLIHNPSHQGHAVLAAERIAREARVPVQLESGNARLQAHMGVALWPDSAVDATMLLRQCELAVAESRERDEAYVVYDKALATARGCNRDLPVFDVEEVLERGEFELYYQPQVALRSGKLVGAEALIRWHSPGNGVQAPASFLAGVENSRGIHALFAFTLKAALRQACEWTRRMPDFKVSVNMSPGNLEDPDLLDAISDSLGVWGLPPEQLVLEITETALMRDARTSAVKLAQLRALGVRLAIDDFGTGHASLSYIRDLPADELKIDRSFVAPVRTSERDRRIVGSVIQLAQAVDMRVVAEGIEESAVMQTLQSMGCDIGQGFYFGAPMPADRFNAVWISRFGKLPSIRA